MTLKPQLPISLPSNVCLCTLYVRHNSGFRFRFRSANASFGICLTLLNVKYLRKLFTRLFGCPHAQIYDMFAYTYVCMYACLYVCKQYLNSRGNKEANLTRIHSWVLRNALWLSHVRPQILNAEGTMNFTKILWRTPDMCALPNRDEYDDDDASKFKTVQVNRFTSYKILSADEKPAGV